MEKLCGVIKDFLISELGPYLAELTDSSTPLPAFTEKNCVVGAVDLDLYKTSQVCFITPDYQDSTELTIDNREERTTVQILVCVRQNKKDVLFRQAMRYGGAIKKAIKNDYTIQNNFDQATINRFEYFDQVEAFDGNVQAVVLELNIVNEF